MPSPFRSALLNIMVSSSPPPACCRPDRPTAAKRISKEVAADEDPPKCVLSVASDHETRLKALAPCTSCADASAGRAGMPEPPPERARAQASDISGGRLARGGRAPSPPTSPRGSCDTTAPHQVKCRRRPSRQCSCQLQASPPKRWLRHTPHRNVKRRGGHPRALHSSSIRQPRRPHPARTPAARQLAFGITE